MKLKTILGQITSEILELVFGTVQLVLFLIFTVILSPIFLYRFILSKLTPVMNPSLGKLLSVNGQVIAADNFTSLKQSPRGNFIISIALEGQQTLEGVKQLMMENVISAKLADKSDLKYPELTQYVTTYPKYFGFRFWKQETNFCIDDHVILNDLGKSPVCEEDVQDFIEMLLNEPFESEKSPWTLFLTNNFVNKNLSSEPMTLVTMKFHHSLSDAFGMLYLFMDHLGSGVAAIPKQTCQRRSIFKMLMFPLKAPYEVMKLFALHLSSHPWRISDKKKAWKQLYRKSPVIPIDKIKNIKNSLNVSFPSVVTSAIAAACAKSLDDQFGKSGTGRDLKAGFILPLPGHPKILRNHMTGAVLNLLMDVNDPLERLKMCNNEISKGKSSVVPILGKYMPKILGSLNTELIYIFGKGKRCAVGITNFAIGADHYELLERKVLSISVGVGATRGRIGMAVAVYSYVDGVEFAISVEEALMSHKHVEKFIEYILEEIDLLHDLSLI